MSDPWGDVEREIAPGPCKRESRVPLMERVLRVRGTRPSMLPTGSPMAPYGLPNPGLGASETEFDPLSPALGMRRSGLGIPVAAGDRSMAKAGVPSVHRGTPRRHAGRPASISEASTSGRETRVPGTDVSLFISRVSQSGTQRRAPHFEMPGSARLRATGKSHRCHSMVEAPNAGSG